MTLASILSLYLQGRWNRNTLQLGKRYFKEAMLLDPTKFVKDEITLANDPLYYRDSVNRYLEKVPAKNHGKK